jgi:hypothetical protein
LKGLIVLICSVLTLSLVTSLVGLLSTQKKVRQYLEMPAYVGPVPEHVRSAIIARVPLGSSRQNVQDFLSSRGIGKDGDSSCEEGAVDGVIICSVGAQNHAWQPIREIYTFSFEFDSDQRLRGVEVRSRVAGP